MDSLHELTQVVEDLSRAASFKDAAERLVHWGRSLTGCDSAILRLRGAPESEPWLAVCALDGPSTSFVRDETVVGESECICGRVATGAVDRALPFYTEGGSFHWGQMDSFSRQFAPEQAGPLRGRCVEEGYQSLAVFPLRAGEMVVGSLHLADSRPDQFVSSVEVIEAACRLAGDILVRHEASERELALLEAVQEALLPRVPRAVEGLSVGVSFESATEMARLGGDFYDVLDLGEAGVLVLVGDVSGKGVEAAAAAAQARHALETHASVSPEPASFMSMTNESLLRLLQPGRFVTAAACLVDPRSGRLTTCLAGHPPPLRLTISRDADVRGVELEAPHNAPLGIWTGLRFEEKSERLGPHDVLLIYTDGVTESRRAGEFFGSEGVVNILKSMRGRSRDVDAPSQTSTSASKPGPMSVQTEDIARDVRSAAAAYHDPSLPGDDRLVLAIRLDGSRRA